MSNLLTEIAWGIVNGGTGLLVNGRGAQASKGPGVDQYRIFLSENRTLDDNEMMLTLTPISIGDGVMAAQEAGTDDTKKRSNFRGRGYPSRCRLYVQD